MQVFPIDFPLKFHRFWFLVLEYDECMESEAKQDQEHAECKHWSHVWYDRRCGMQRNSLHKELVTTWHRLTGDGTLSCLEEESGLQRFLSADDERQNSCDHQQSVEDTQDRISLFVWHSLCIIIQ